MSDHTLDKSGPTPRSQVEDRTRAFSVCVFFAAILIAALLLQQLWWTILISIELVVVLGIVHSLGSNLPTRLRRQVKLNSHRSDGSRSQRRSAIERDAVRRFKYDVLVCFAFTLIPANICVLTHLYFFPQLDRIKETTELPPKQQWVAILLEPPVQLILLIALLAAFLYSSLKGIYIRRLKDLDEEICMRAENYAVYDLVNPPKESGNRTSRRESDQHLPGTV